MLRSGVGQDRVNFPQSSWCGTVFCICAGSSVDKAGMFSLLLSSIPTVSRPFQPHTRAERGGGVHGGVRGHSWES